MPYIDSLTPSLPFQSGSDTSHDAAEKSRTFAGKQSKAVLAWWQEVGNSTQRECAEALHLQRASVCARVRELEQAGLLWKTGARRDGCAVYEAELL